MNFLTSYRETITLQVGQCGNQVGLQYWNQLSAEHGILPDGTPKSESQENERGIGRNGSNFDNSHRNDCPDLFFNVSNSNKFTPRSILIDLEPSVIGKCTSTMPMFNPRNVHLSEQGNGAANNWQHGYSYGLQHQEELMNIIDRECDKCDNLSSFQLVHSVAGGTGSGVGSLLLELLSDRYGSKKMLNTILIFPSNEKTSDVVVQPYNTLLTLRRLIDYSDATFAFDNDSLNTIENTLFGVSSPVHHDPFKKSNNAFEGANKLIAFVLATLSNPLRFPSYMYTSNESILSTLVPTPDLKFLSMSIAPFASLSSFDHRISRHNFANHNEYDMILELLNDRYKMNKVGPSPKYISVMNYLIGNNLDQQEIRKGSIRAQQRIEFVPWTSSSIHVVNCRRSPYLPSQNAKRESLNGIQVSNNTSIIHFLSKVIKQFDLLAKREAYVNYYTESNDKEERARVLDLFNECRESVIHTIHEYRDCQDMAYLEDDSIINDDLM